MIEPWTEQQNFRQSSYYAVSMCVCVCVLSCSTEFWRGVDSIVRENRLSFCFRANTMLSLSSVVVHNDIFTRLTRRNQRQHTFLSLSYEWWDEQQIIKLQIKNSPTNSITCANTRYSKRVYLYFMFEHRFDIIGDAKQKSIYIHDHNVYLDVYICRVHCMRPLAPEIQTKRHKWKENNFLISISSRLRHSYECWQ